jgi:hypothetical protein
MIKPTTGQTIFENSLRPQLSLNQADNALTASVLEDRAFVSSEWGMSENNRRARFYTITAAQEARVWIRYAGAVTQVLRTHPSVA